MKFLQPVWLEVISKGQESGLDRHVSKFASGTTDSIPRYTWAWLLYLCICETQSVIAGGGPHEKPNDVCAGYRGSQDQPPALVQIHFPRSWMKV